MAQHRSYIIYLYWKKISINLYYECNILNHKTKINWNNRIENLAEKFHVMAKDLIKRRVYILPSPQHLLQCNFPSRQFQVLNVQYSPCVWWKGSVLYRKLTNRITGKYIWVTKGYKPLNILINTLSRTDSYEMRRVIREHKLLSVVFFGH